MSFTWNFAFKKGKKVIVAQIKQPIIFKYSKRLHVYPHLLVSLKKSVMPSLI